MSLWQELNRRNVFKVGAAYLIFAWLLAQVASVFAPALQLPDWADSFVVFLLILGFPVALFLAWAYEMTPAGIKSTRKVALGESMRTLTGQRLNYVVIGLLAAAVVFLAIDDFIPGRSDDEPVRLASQNDSALPNSVAVLPFDNLSPDPNNAYFAAGLHDEVLNQLAKIEGLRVISRSSVLRYSTDRPPIPEIASTLGVEAILEGTVRFAGDRILVTAQLIDGSSDTHLWSEVYDGNLSNIETIFSQQAEIALEVARRLRTDPSSNEIDRLSWVKTDSGEAYALYLRALNRSDDGLDRFASIRYLMEAIELDPDFAEAYALLADQYSVALFTFDLYTPENPISFTETQQEAVAAATHALALDPNNATAFRALGNLHSFAFRFAEANEAFRRSAELNPSDSANFNNLAMYSAMTGQDSQAVAALRRYQEVSPDDPYAWVLEARVMTFLHRPAEAKAAAEEALRRAPQQADTYFRLARAQIQLGENAAAEASLRTGERLLGGGREGGRAIVERAYSYGRLGLREDAERLFAQFQTANSSSYEDYGQRALAGLAIGDLEQAARNLELVVAKSAAKEPDAGYFGTNNIRRNVLNDPVLETSPFVELRARLPIDLD